MRLDDGSEHGDEIGHARGDTDGGSYACADSSYRGRRTGSRHRTSS